MHGESPTESIDSLYVQYVGLRTARNDLVRIRCDVAETIDQECEAVAHRLLALMKTAPSDGNAATTEAAKRAEIMGVLRTDHSSAISARLTPLIEKFRKAREAARDIPLNLMGEKSDAKRAAERQAATEVYDLIVGPFADPRMQQSAEQARDVASLKEDLDAVFFGLLEQGLMHAGIAIDLGHESLVMKELFARNNELASAEEIEKRKPKHAQEIWSKVQEVWYWVQSQRGVHDVFPFIQREQFQRLPATFRLGNRIGLECTFRYMDTYYVHMFPRYQSREKTYPEWLKRRSLELYQSAQYQANQLLLNAPEEYDYLNLDLPGKVTAARARKNFLDRYEQFVEGCRYLSSHDGLSTQLTDDQCWILSDVVSNASDTSRSSASILRQFIQPPVQRQHTLFAFRPPEDPKKNIMEEPKKKRKKKS